MLANVEWVDNKTRAGWRQTMDSGQGGKLLAMHSTTTIKFEGGGRAPQPTAEVILAPKCHHAFGQKEGGCLWGM
jgi:hypothetical protein